MGFDPCSDLNKSINGIRNPVNKTFSGVIDVLNKAIDALNNGNASVYGLFNTVINLLSDVLTKPLQPINELTTHVKDMTAALLKIPVYSILGIIQIMILPFMYNVKQGIDSLFWFLPNVPIDWVVFVVAFLAFIFFAGQVVGSLFMFNTMAFNSVGFLVSNFAQPVFGTGMLANLGGWLLFGVLLWGLTLAFVRIPVPCYCGDAPSSTILVCQSGSEKDSDNCKNIALQNQRMSEATSKISSKLGDLASKAEALLPDLPLDRLPEIQLPKKIPHVPQVTLIPESKIPSCDIGDAIKKGLDKVGKDIKHDADDTGNAIAHAFGF